ncbi:hypothetical protein UB51_01830 [Paenibacillus sp. IHBB 10380]|nr:hypothetical protein UB51_01830 [Paenibacillus sp. IHBB 10380]
MFSYIVKNMYRHKLRLFLTFILLVTSFILVSFSLQVLLNFSNMINSSWTKGRRAWGNFIFINSVEGNPRDQSHELPFCHVV